MSASQQTLQELIEKGQQAFRNTFGYEAEVASFAPGRVNLIGEHIDYNDGFALPMASIILLNLISSHHYLYYLIYSNIDTLF